MDLSAALNETLNHFGISAKQLSETTGVRQATISEFRNGKREIHTSQFERIVSGLSPEAKQYLFLKAFIGQLDQEGIAMLLNVAANQIRQPKNVQLSKIELSFSK